MNEEEEGEEVKLNPMEKMRVRMASEGYQAMERENAAKRREKQEENGGRQGDSSCSLSVLEKVMAVFLVLVIVIAVVLCVLLVLKHFTCDEATQACSSPECVELSGSLLKNMDLSADPCEDFYQYACGRFDDDPLIPQSSKKYSWFSFMNTRALALSKKVLDEKGHVYQRVNSSAIEKVKMFYDVCMNVSLTETMGITPLLKWIKSLGSWTATSDEYSGTWSEDDFHLETSLAVFNLQAITPLFIMRISPDEMDNKVNRITFDQNGLSLADYTNYLGNTSAKYHQVFTQYIVNVVTILGGNQVQAETIAEELWQFESEMAKIMDKPEERQDAHKLYNKMTVHDLQQKMNPLGDVFNLAEFLATVFKQEVPGTEEVVVRAPIYFSKLGPLIQKTDKKTLANYMMWQAVQEVMPVQPRVLQVAAHEARSVLEGTSGEVSGWLQCVGLTASAMAEALGALYVQRYFRKEDKQQVENLLDTIVDQFKARLPKNPWMDDETMRKAAEKVDAIGYKVGYPPFITDPVKLDKYYEKLVVRNINNFDNFLSALKFVAVQMFEKRGKPPDLTEWSMGPTTCNAYYSALQNEMVFPAAILNQPFFSADFPMAMNFGSMGFIMGHELTHGFDNKGSKFDQHGNLENWWSNSSTKHFEEKTQCLVNQYSRYTVEGQHLNGLTTLGENIADNGGMRTSYRAYQAWMKSHGYAEERARLPGLNTTENQLFFLAFAQTWCAYYTPQYALQSLVTDVHSYAKYRVIGTLSNSKEFSNTYSCPKGSPMNPEHKCTVW